MTIGGTNLNGFVTIRGREIPETWLWAVGGVIGLLLGLPFYPTLLMFQVSGGDPGVLMPTVVVLVAVGTLALVARRLDRPAAVRAWAAIAWCLLTGWAFVVVIIALGKAVSVLPITDVPEFLLAIVAVPFFLAIVAAPFFLLSLAGSALIAVASFQFSGRWIAVRHTTTPSLPLKSSQGSSN